MILRLLRLTADLSNEPLKEYYKMKFYKRCTLTIILFTDTKATGLSNDPKVNYILTSYLQLYMNIYFITFRPPIMDNVISCDMHFIGETFFKILGFLSSSYNLSEYIFLQFEYLGQVYTRMGEPSKFSFIELKCSIIHG